jgi:hypothetical protein
VAEPWMPSAAEIDNVGQPQEDKDTKIAEMQRTIDYLVNARESDDAQQRIKREFNKVKADKKHRMSPSKGFTKVHKLITQKAVIDKMFKPLEERMLFKLIPFCNLESNFICDVDGMPMNQKSIIALTGMTKNDVIEVMGNLLEYGVITKFIQGKSTFYKFSKDWIGN